MKSSLFTAIKKNLNENGFEIRFLRTKETHGILRKVQSFEKNKKTLANLFNGTLILIQPKTPAVLLKTVPLKIIQIPQFILMGLFLEGLFYNPKMTLDFLMGNQEQKTNGEIVSSLTFSMLKSNTLLQSPLFSLLFLIDVFLVKKTTIKDSED